MHRPDRITSPSTSTRSASRPTPRARRSSTSTRTSADGGARTTSRTSWWTRKITPTPDPTTPGCGRAAWGARPTRSEEHTSELQSRLHLVCRLLLEKKKKHNKYRLADERNREMYH